MWWFYMAKKREMEVVDKLEALQQHQKKPRKMIKKRPVCISIIRYFVFNANEPKNSNSKMIYH